MLMLSYSDKKKIHTKINNLPTTNILKCIDSLSRSDRCISDIKSLSKCNRCYLKVSKAYQDTTDVCPSIKSLSRYNKYISKGQKLTKIQQQETVCTEAMILLIIPIQMLIVVF